MRSRDVYVGLPDEDPKAKQPGVCGETAKDDVRIFGHKPNDGEEHYAQVLGTGGFSRGVASPCHFDHNDLETYITVHGDDFSIVGRQEGRKRMH